jgi:hypothetical protein
MRDCIDIGSAPPMEDCAPLGRPDYEKRARRECRAYLALLRRTLGDEPFGARLALKYCPHDFGTYLTVACYFDDSEAAAVDYAFSCEGKGPECWDDQARQELQQAADKAGKEKTP